MAEENDMTSLQSVKIEHGALDESPLRGGTIILRGVIDPATLKNLKVDDYQREARSLFALDKLIQAIERSDVLPDIEIGMRGTRSRDGNKGSWFLLDDCYIIDGQQRTNACISVLLNHPNIPVRLGAMIHFATDYTWERERFRVLNAERTKVSPNVLLRNSRADHPSIQMLYSFSDSASSGFCLAGRVSWKQSMGSGDLVTATNFCKVICQLHSHISAGPHGSRKKKVGDVNSVGARLDNIAEQITPSLLRENTKAFYNLIDEVWGVRSVKYAKLAPQLKGTFLFSLARVLSSHTDFWRNGAAARLFVDVEVRRKLEKFKLQEANVAALTGSGGMAGSILFGMIVRHINSGRRKANWLQANADADLEVNENEQQDEAA